MAPTLVLASPAGDPLMRELAQIIGAGGVHTLSVPLEVGGSDVECDAVFRTALEEVSGDCVIGGFSLGARIAARACASVDPLGLLCFGYPFHVSRDAGLRHGLAVLREVRVPTRVIQGTRDNHGSEAEVRGYGLSESIELVWLTDGNHRFVPRASSGLTLGAHVEAAGVAGLAFVRSCLRP